LPYIDEHSIAVGATRERAWRALCDTLRTSLSRAAPAPLARAWQLQPPRASGDWRATPRVGDSLTGFTVAELQPCERLELRGRHRFSRYALVFELDAADGDRDRDGDGGGGEEGEGEGCTLRAQTYAAFPGIAGRAYRALVIGSHGHELVVRRLLRGVARRA
jgi:hypothetical protein